MAAQSYATLRTLTRDANEPIERIVMRAVYALDGLRETAIFQLRLIPAAGEAPQRTVFSIAISPTGAVLLEDDGRRVLDRNAFTVLTTGEMFRRIAGGTHSPVQAYLDGHLHLHGNVEFGKRLVRRLATPGTAAAFCPVPDDEAWQASSAVALTFSRDFYSRQRRYLRREPARFGGF